MSKVMSRETAHLSAGKADYTNLDSDREAAVAELRAYGRRGDAELVFDGLADGWDTLAELATAGTWKECPAQF